MDLQVQKSKFLNNFNYLIKILIIYNNILICVIYILIRVILTDFLNNISIFQTAYRNE